MKNNIDGFKLALLGSIKEGIADPVALADYLVYQLNLNGQTDYLKTLDLDTEMQDIVIILEKICQRFGFYRKRGAKDPEGPMLDLELGAKYLVRRYRKGELGKFVLDRLPETISPKPQAPSP
eukprot:CAMPEP_0184319076 /NCGR_PEP_ID=MMETSP1049-20130417/106458_1 /TAXON_ID=77928 /ORGANISM="Proteomonas sulcata, Strain CCMP704" /LENGTH=121 /DNA_ID=CAMNT_0026639083 /DNA_START=1 /DNA_END=362 /DNA_ORIENTATION=+